jgi:hypothetical protein
MNNNIQEKLVSFETAKLLKEKGFSVKCEWAYQHNKLVHDSKNRELKNWNEVKHVECSAPTQQLAIDWIRINYGIHIFVDFGLGWEGFTIPCGYQGNATIKDLHWNCSNFNTPEEAKEAAIIYVLEKLINK